MRACSIPFYEAFLATLVAFLIPAQVYALSVEASGQAALAGAVSHVREQALQDAMRQASLRAGAQISSTQLMEQGVISADKVELRSQSELHNVQILSEYADEGVYHINIRADVQARSMCPNSSQRYRKAIVVTGFGLAQPMQATLGHLENIEQALPGVLVDTLNNRGVSHAMDASHTSLYQDPRRAPAMATPQQRLTTSVALATQLGAQYVISGVVRDLSLAGTSRPTERDDSLLSLFGLSEAAQQRQFMLDVFVHDGLSGALLFQRNYTSSGQWDVPRQRAIGFATPEFWRTSYGSSVQGLLTRVVDDLQEVIRCQPFMARVVKARGTRLHIEASAGAGIRPGDKFKVYRTGTIYNRDLEPRTELSDMATEAVVRQVQPQFVIAEMENSAEYLAIQRDDMVIAW